MAALSQVYILANMSTTAQTITRDGVSVTVQPRFAIALDWPNGDVAAAMATGNFMFVGADANDMRALGYNPQTQKVIVRL